MSSAGIFEGADEMRVASTIDTMPVPAPMQMNANGMNNVAERLRDEIHA